MGRRFPGSAGGGGGGGGGGTANGEFNAYRIYRHSGSYTWTKPSNLKEGSRILVHVWGAGGCGGQQGTDTGRGGGGGGLAVKYIDETALGATEAITIGVGSEAVAGIGGTTSFGSHCSATGGNSGHNATDNEGSGALYGVGGLGLQGDINRRGGRGGSGYNGASTNAGGGGGGSAPAPYGISDGFDGGRGRSTRSGGGGGGIGGKGGDSVQGGAGGGGSAGPGQHNNVSYYTGGGGAGLMNDGGQPRDCQYGYASYGDSGDVMNGGNGGDGAELGPNTIIFGGGGGAGGTHVAVSSGYYGFNAGHGGPGGGGGGHNEYSTSQYGFAGNGGILGGGGGSSHQSSAGHGGNAGGGGGCGYGGSTYWGHGGHGLIIIQYRIDV